MKRTTLIFLTAIYLLSCIGVGVNRFYCCGKLASVTLTYAAAAQTHNKNNCCKHESKSFKVKDSHFSAVPFFINHPAPAIVSSAVQPGNEIPISFLHTKIVYKNKSNAPPGNSDIPAYTLNCTYKI